MVIAAVLTRLNPGIGPIRIFKPRWPHSIRLFRYILMSAASYRQAPDRQPFTRAGCGWRTRRRNDWRRRFRDRQGARPVMNIRTVPPFATTPFAATTSTVQPETGSGSIRRRMASRADVGIKSSGVHYHFPTKEDLAASVIRRWAEYTSELIDEDGSRFVIHAGLLQDRWHQTQSVCDMPRKDLMVSGR
jgi:hypothetical protein